jgi:SET domain
LSQSPAPRRRLRLRVSPIHGLGVFAAVPIKARMRLIEYTGERITQERADARCENDPGGRAFAYMFTLTKRLIIDAARRGNLARFINHSCDPNCESITEGNRVFIYTTRAIRAGEELVYDYHLTVNGPREADWRTTYACRCGSPKCRGSILEADADGPLPRRRPRAGRAAAPAVPKGGTRGFPAEFAELLSERGLAVLCNGPRGGSLDVRRNTPLLALSDVLEPRRLAGGLAALERDLLGVLRPQRVPIPRSAPSRLRRKEGERLPSTLDVRSADLDGRGSAAARAALACGLYPLLHSQTFRLFAEAVSGLRLQQGWSCQVQCYGSGGYLGPQHDHAPGQQRPRGGTLDLHVSLCSEGVEAQWLVYEQRGLLSGTVPLGRRAAVIACRLPFWHYTTPLLARPGRARHARRWVLAGSFEIAEG